MAQRKDEERNIRIHVYGIVQSVGFRPFVTRLARRYSITGSVKNKGGLVEIKAMGSQEALDDFYNDILLNKPKLALIVHSDVTKAPPEEYDSFTIEKSEDTSGLVFISPDIAVCEDCQSEMNDKKDARYMHPFISCMSCGPRYSIIESAPYDRASTTMRDFEMCSECSKEYTDINDRRNHAQTISCHNCGPYLIFRNESGKESYREDAFSEAAGKLKTGGIIAVKGIGGYHLVCSPYIEDTVLRLRGIKMREQKPFAVMFPDIESLKEHCSVSKAEEEILLSDARPIVLLEKGEKVIAPAVCNKSRFIGAFLPYTPLQAMLLRKCGPLIMTSANISEDPIISDDEEMMAWSEPLDGVLYNSRKIAVKLDDSVVKAVGGKTQVIRRSRGYAPLPVMIKEFDIENRDAVFAAGGQLKSAFCLSSGKFAYMSQHIGDLDGRGNSEVYAKNFERMKSIFRIEPELAVCDMHPEYASTAFAQTTGLPVLKVQHHHAHIASVIAEHGIERPVIGVSFDGTGYGEDGAVWGGEFLICEGAEYKRAGHLKYIKFLNGDEGMKDAAKSSMFYLYDSGIEEKINDTRWPLIKAALQNGINTHLNSSMGRLFDAVSAAIGVCSYNRFEGECAIDLENLAYEAHKEGISPLKLGFKIYEDDDMLIADASPVFRVLMKIKSVDKKADALGFHIAVADMVIGMCEKLREKTGISDVALSGGVFQNSVLISDVLYKLKENGFTAYINEAVPPNDGGISLGQAYIGLKTLEKKL